MKGDTRMLDERMESIHKKVQQAVALIQRLKEEKENLRNEIVRMQDEIQKLKEEANALKEEREAIKGKIDAALSTLDEVDLEDVLETMADEVEEEAEE